MRITLVFPPFYHPSLYNLPPLGLINLATSLDRAVHEVTLLDQVLAIRTGELAMGRHIYREAAEQILATNPDLVAFSAQCTTYPPILQIARHLKLVRPELLIALGGHNATFLAAPTLERSPQVDLVLRGEGETGFRELVATLAAGGELAGVAGLSWRRGEAIVNNPDRPLMPNLDSLPLPDYSLVPSLDTYRRACDLSRSIAILEIGRGCPHDCVYCSEAALWQRRTRTYSIDRVLREMRTLRERQGAECFLLAYDQFTADRDYVERFCRGVLEAGLQDTPWYCISRLDTVDADLLALMRQAGCESMCYGIDSGSARTLAFIRKRIDRTILFDRVRQTTDLGLVPTLSFVIGFPEEELADIDATLNLALQCGIQGNSSPLLQMPTVLPGTDLHRRYWPGLVRQVDTYFALGLEFDSGRRLAEDDRLIDTDPELFSSFWNLCCPALPAPDLARIARGFPLLVELFPKTFFLLCRALAASPARLFLQFVNKALVTDVASSELSAPACLHHFPVFARTMLRSLAGRAEWGYLVDLLLYETSALEVAAFASEPKPGIIDTDRSLCGWPQRPRNVRVVSFDHDLPAIVADLKAGVERHDYSRQPCWLAFRQQGKQLTVSEINRFGQNLIALCDGRTGLEDLADALWPNHGHGMARDEFLAACRAAVRDLSRIGLLVDSHPEADTQRR